jgi:hypothetical protein
MTKKLTHEIFLERANKIHDNFYSYPENYITANTKIGIICPKHGIFQQTPWLHMLGQGCSKCVGKNKTTNDYISEAKEVHGEKYKYHLIKYENCNTPVEIICPEHGVFKQLISSHLLGYGCGKCAGNKLKTTDEFKAEAKEINGEKYDYSLVIYKNSQTDVDIICRTHGVFHQSPAHHLQGGGCPKCLGRNKTTGEFNIQAGNIHNFFYTYPDEYVRANQKIRIICPEHGDFYQTPNKHLSGGGCGKCVGLYKTTEEFRNEARKIHNNFYEYPDEYVLSETKMRIICSVHGEFYQTPKDHLQGKRCQRCAGVNLKTTDEFREDAINVHGDKYKYHLVDYKGAHVKVKILCGEHGEFEQTPHSHLSGGGCPECKKSRGESKIRNFLNICNITFTPQYKFDDCRNVNPLPFDFGILDNNGSFLGVIEYQGEQHYGLVNFSGKLTKEKQQENFEKTMSNDFTKKCYCDFYKKPLLCIPYFEKNWKDVLKNFLENDLGLVLNKKNNQE